MIHETTQTERKYHIWFLFLCLSAFVIVHAIIVASLFHRSSLNKQRNISKITDKYDKMIEENDFYMVQKENVKIHLERKDLRNMLRCFTYDTWSMWLLAERLDRGSSWEYEHEKLKSITEKEFEEALAQYKKLLEIELEKIQKLTEASERFFPLHLILIHLFVSVLISAGLGYAVEKFAV